MKTKVFPCSGAGRWFPANSEELGNLIDRCLNNAQDTVSPHPSAIIVPHAGYLYSGEGAGVSYHVLKGKEIKRVIILGPSHHSGLHGISVLKGYDTYQTPLGNVPIDRVTVDRLLKNSPFLFEASAHASEHSVENQIPFIQRVIPDAKIVPCVVGFLDKTSAREAGKQLSSLLDDKTILVVSSDFTHFGQSFDYVPFNKDIRRNLEKLDQGAIHFIQSCDGDGFLNYVESTGATICGRYPIAVALYALSGKCSGRLLKYYTSSDKSEDFSHAVCYASIVLEEKKEDQLQLSTENKMLLLQLARKSMESAVRQQPMALIKDIPENLRQDCGAFVTLTKKGELRGCIGYILPVAPLAETVIEMAKAAALHDNRFMPVEPTELGAIHIEISVLTPPVQISGPEEFVLGQHGIVINLNGHQAVFLPQVALEQKWDKTTTLRHLCLKAGLQPDDYKNPQMTFKVFEAIILEE